MQTIIIISVIISLVIWRLYRAKIKGIIGEKTTAVILNFLNKSQYRVVNNLVLKIDNRTTQIDHVVISDFGVFVIETKNFKGWILGGESSMYWTQVLFKRKEKFYNPILQNLSHIKALKACLAEYPHIAYISIIVFPSKASIKVNTQTEVIYSSRLLNTIKKYSAHNLSSIEKDNIYQSICELNLSDTFNKQKHVQAIKQRIQKTKAAITDKCPQCYANLVLRNGKYSQFFGCINYPSCKFTKNL